MHTAKFVLFSVLIALVFTACSAVQPTPTIPSEVVIVALPTQTPEPTLTVTPTATTEPTAVPTQTATSSPTPTPSPTATPDPSCPEPGSAAAFAYPADTTELQTSILAYLNAGGQWEDLFALFDELGIEYDWVQADMNGDGVEETAVYAKMQPAEYEYEKGWWIFHCKSDNYQAVYSTVGSIYGFHDYFEVDDVNNDGQFEIIKIGGYATSACHWIPVIWSWQSGEIVDLFTDRIYPGCSIHDRMILQDLDDDNLKEIIVVGTTVVHLDNAPPRIITQTFSFEETGYTLTNKIFAPAEYRFQLLDDAQRALDESNLPLAISYYSQAAHYDISTLNSKYFSSPEIAKEHGEEPDYPDAYQKAFALFRLATIQLVLEDNDTANNALTELITAYSEDQQGFEFVQLTQIFFDTFNQEKNQVDACNQVTDFVSEHYTDWPQLTSHFYWGANITAYHTPESFCPVFPTPTENEP